MNIKKILFYLLAVILGGCVPVMSLHPIYTEEDIVFEKQLLGTWIDDSNESTWEFSHPEQELKEYHLIYTDNENRKGSFEAHLVKLENKLFLDCFPAQSPCNLEDPNKIDWFYNAIFLIPVHTFIKVDSLEPKLKLRLTNIEEFKEFLERDPNAVKFEAVEDTPVLSASTEELQKFVLKYAEVEKVFPVEIILNRQKISKANDTAPK